MVVQDGELDAREGNGIYYYYYCRVVHLQMQPEGYGAAICIFELQARIASSSPLFLLLQCCEALLFYRLVFIFVSPSGGCFLAFSGLKRGG